MDRQAIARALAKAQAYRQCGKQKECEEWAAELVRLLDCAGILKTEEAITLAPWETPAHFGEEDSNAIV